MNAQVAAASSDEALEGTLLLVVEDVPRRVHEGDRLEARERVVAERRCVLALLDLDPVTSRKATDRRGSRLCACASAPSSCLPSPGERHPRGWRKPHRTSHHVAAPKALGRKSTNGSADLPLRPNAFASFHSSELPMRFPMSTSGPAAELFRHRDLETRCPRIRRSAWTGTPRQPTIISSGRRCARTSSNSTGTTTTYDASGRRTGTVTKSQTSR